MYVHVCTIFGILAFSQADDNSRILFFHFGDSQSHLKHGVPRSHSFSCLFYTASILMFVMYDSPHNIPRPFRLVLRGSQVK